MFNIVRNKYSKCITLHFYINKQLFGKSCYSINNKEAIINNICIIPKYRKIGFGSQILNRTENIILNDTNNINRFSLLAYDRCYGKLTMFFKKNGYIIDTNKKIYLLDDGEYIIDLVPMIKNIKNN